MTDESVVMGLINSVEDPVFTIIPNSDMGDEGYLNLFHILEELLTKLEERSGIKFDILIDGAGMYGGYNELIDEAQAQKGAQSEDSDQPETWPS